jgi:hypothetical protein
MLEKAQISSNAIFFHLQALENAQGPRIFLAEKIVIIRLQYNKLKNILSEIYALKGNKILSGHLNWGGGGGETRLIRSTVINWRSGISDFPAFFSPRKVNLKFHQILFSDSDLT